MIRKYINTLARGYGVDLVIGGKLITPYFVTLFIVILTIAFPIILLVNILGIDISGMSVGWILAPWLIAGYIAYRGATLNSIDLIVDTIESRPREKRLDALKKLEEKIKEKNDQGEMHPGDVLTQSTYSAEHIVSVVAESLSTGQNDTISHTVGSCLIFLSYDFSRLPHGPDENVRQYVKRETDAYYHDGEHPVDQVIRMIQKGMGEIAHLEIISETNKSINKYLETNAGEADSVSEFIENLTDKDSTAEEFQRMDKDELVDPMTNKAVDSASDIETALVKNVDAIEAVGIEFVDEGSEITYSVDVMGEFDKEVDFLAVIAVSLQYLNISRLGPQITIRCTSPTEYVTVTTVLEKDISETLAKMDQITPNSINEVGDDIIRRLQVSGDDADELFKKWVVSKVPEIKGFSIDENRVVFESEIGYMNDTEEEVVIRLSDKFDAGIMFICVFFVGNGCAYDSVEVRGLSQEGHTLASFVLTTELAEQRRYNKIETKELGTKLVETLRTEIPAPETEDAAREQLLNLYRQVSPDHLQVLKSYSVGNVLEITYNMMNIQKRAGDEDILFQKSSLNQEDIMNFVIKDIADFTKVTLNWYDKSIDIDKIVFFVAVESEDPIFRYDINIEWIEAALDDHTLTGDLLDNVSDSFEPV